MHRRSKATVTPYTLEGVSRACNILRVFEDDRQTLSLTEIVERTGLERTVCFRLLRTLADQGLLRRSDKTKYASNVRILGGKRFRIGYASQTSDSFCSALAQGLRWAAASRPIDLIEVENRYSIKIALRNADHLVARGVDLAIEFQTYERIGAKVAQFFEEAGIPLIAVEIPHPNSVFLGVDNQRAGAVAGRALLKAAQAQWQGKCDEVLFLDLEIAGSLPHLRLSSAQTLLRSGLNSNCVLTHLDSRGEFVRSFELTRRHLQFAPKRRTLVTGINDYAVLGALRAFEEAGRSNMCLAVSHGGGPEARRELRLPSTPLVATVAFFPEKYGESLLLLALDILNKRATPPAVYMPVQILTRKNVDDFYPLDVFPGTSDNKA
ncbi:MAG TPA: substrate-binding domain-containing protein [Terracidiphilus sp.]|nr:substrate-binding domain-containing protein [Terracidiphilus sp.]